MGSNKDEIHCCFLMEKTTVTSRKFVYIPRLELTAAVLSAKCGKFINRELQLECTHETFWTDSKVVLGYIQNSTKRLKIFVTNRVHQIHESWRVEQWRYVPAKLNPTDHVSCGLGIADLEEQAPTWIHSPKFLWQKEKNLAKAEQLWLMWRRPWSERFFEDEPYFIKDYHPRQIRKNLFLVKKETS